MSLFFEEKDPLDLFFELEIGGQKVPTDNDKEEQDQNEKPSTVEELKPADPAGETTDYTADDTAAPEPEATEPPTNDATGDPPPDNPPDEGQQGDDTGNAENEGNSDQDGDTTDYTADDGGDGGEGDTDGEDGGEEGEDDTDDSSTDDPDTNEDNIKKLEDELFAALSPEQMDIKHKELKTQFSEIYNVINGIIERINDMPKDEKYVQTIEFTSNKLSELKDMVTDYVMDVYETKSYMENAITYNKFLATLNGINRVLEKITFKDGK